MPKTTVQHVPVLAQWFIRRPHAIDRMRTHAGYPDDVPDDKIEQDLRDALSDTHARLLRSRKDNQFAVRVAVPDRNVVYAILKPPATIDKGYHYIVPTVLTQEMYQSWSRDGHLGTMDDLPPEKKSMPQLKQMLCIRWVNGDGREHFGDYCVDDTSEEIRKLISQGVKPSTIRVYKEVPYAIEISIGE